MAPSHNQPARSWKPCVFLSVVLPDSHFRFSLLLTFVSRQINNLHALFGDKMEKARVAVFMDCSPSIEVQNPTGNPQS